jgi:hypothetical protein
MGALQNHPSGTDTFFGVLNTRKQFLAIYTGQPNSIDCQQNHKMQKAQTILRPVWKREPGMKVNIDLATEYHRQAVE